MHESTRERVQLAAAQFVAERGSCKAPERIELLAKNADASLPSAELTPGEADIGLVRGASRNLNIDQVQLWRPRVRISRVVTYDRALPLGPLVPNVCDRATACNNFANVDGGNASQCCR